MELSDEKIKAYLKGTLPEAELPAFKAAVEAAEMGSTLKYLQGLYQSGQAQQAWAELADLQAFVNDEAALSEAKTELEALLQEDTHPVKVRRLNVRTWLSIAASIVLLVIAAWFFLQPASTPTILAFEPTFYQSSSALTSSSDLSRIYERGFQAFQQNNIQWLLDSVPAYQALYPYNSDYIPRLIQLQGMALFNQNRFEEAATVLGQLPLASAPGLEEWRYEVQYYRAVALVKSGDEVEGRGLFRQLELHLPKDLRKDFDLENWQ